MELSKEAVSKILAQHQLFSRGMVHGAPDVCTCGDETWPAMDRDEDVMIRRHRAFARHQAEVLSIVSPAQPCRECRRKKGHKLDCSRQYPRTYLEEEETDGR